MVFASPATTRSAQYNKIEGPFTLRRPSSGHHTQATNTKPQHPVHATHAEIEIEGLSTASKSLRSPKIHSLAKQISADAVGIGDLTGERFPPLQRSESQSPLSVDSAAFSLVSLCPSLIAGAAPDS